MEQILSAIILGVVQGLTEFLPVSSSGHIVIVNYILDFLGMTGAKYDPEKNMLMATMLHGATALSTIYIFRKNITEIISGLISREKKEVDFSIKIIISMIPAVIVGLLWEDSIKHLFNEDSNLIQQTFGGALTFVGLMLIITSILLFFADKSKPTNKNVSLLSSLIIGLSQAIAILPGISRSGATISTSVLLGIDKEKSTKFSFLMVVPLILGKITKDILFEKIEFSSSDSLPILFGFISSFIVGIFACTLMIKIVKNSKLRYFAYYCILIALTIILFDIYDPS